MTKELCMNLLGVLDGTAKPSKALVQFAHTCGSARDLHAKFRTAMQAAGWSDGGAVTVVAALLTPHVRAWEILVDAQRKPLQSVFDVKVEAKWEGPAETDKEPTVEEPTHG